MGVPIEVLGAIPVSAIAVVAIVRYGPEMVLTVLAGFVTIFTRDSERGKRALAVLRLLRRPPRGSRQRQRRASDRPQTKAE